MTPKDTPFTLVLGNKNYSSWSLRAWLAAKLTGQTFAEIVIPLYEPDSKDQLLAHSPAGKVPVLKLGDLVVWDSLAIGETLAEAFPDAHLWPADRTARGHARSIVAEMHSGFVALRDQMPMDVMGDYARFERYRELGTEIARMSEIWRDCRARFGAGGPFLFGTPSLADAFFAPVAFRFRSFAVPLEGAAAAYQATLLAWPLMVAWQAAAREEPWRIAWPALEAD